MLRCRKGGDGEKSKPDGGGPVEKVGGREPEGGGRGLRESPCGCWEGCEWESSWSFPPRVGASVSWLVLQDQGQSPALGRLAVHIKVKK